ncbi:hypothetical protein WOLCODRAFT_161791 [Wolfiporia cocos MD-104 SS10]|uniref:Uncharacterized protein n=1 Tax=Wolfiporia cocos (strain MD-104) TaxID=742152 RepID=A0A2H3J931_WOLCO|nr:hypothetical protein WOLCODRAFT_161791 [Wolfiporia cocos MD-104 SS10]
MATSFTLLQRCLTVGLNCLSEKQKTPATSAEFVQLRNELFQRSVDLNETYSHAAFELRVGRLSSKSIRPLTGIVEHLRRELAWGCPLAPKLPPLTRTTSHNSSRASSRRPSFSRRSSRRNISVVLLSHAKFVSAVEAPMLSLGHAIIAAMKAVELLIVVTFDQDKGAAYKSAHGEAYMKSGSVKYALRVAEQMLIRSRNEAREQLGRIFDEMNLEQH